MSSHSHDPAAAVLHSFESGGHNLVALARRRIARVLDELDRGDFCEALDAANAVGSALQPLAHAQVTISIAEGSRLVLAREMKQGMRLTNVGEVTDVEVTHCPVESCTGHVTLKFGEHEVKYDGSVELYVDEK